MPFVTGLWRMAGNQPAFAACCTKHRGNTDRAIADFRRATEFPSKGLFDAAAQAEARKHIEQVGKRVPCSSGRTTNSDTCL